MRVLGWSLASLPTLALVAVAQPPSLNPAGQQRPGVPAAMPASPPNAPAANRLDEVLAQWEQQMKGVESLVATIRRTDQDDVAKTKDEWRGQLKFQKPNRADLYYQKVTNPQVYERYLCTGGNLFRFLPTRKLIEVYALPQRAAGQPVMDNTFVGFLAGMSATEAKRRFEMTLMKEDQWYVYLEIKPRFPDDKAEFSNARIALYKSNLMPREMQFVPPTGNLVKWDIDNVQANVPLAATDFATPQLKQYPGWQFQNMPAPGTATPPSQPQPTKVRPQAGK